MKDPTPATKHKVSLLIESVSDKGEPIFIVFKRQKGTDKWWDLPGGKRDPLQTEEGERLETIVEAAIREAKEELGIQLDAKSFRLIFSEASRHSRTPDTETKFIMLKLPEGQKAINRETTDHLAMEFVTAQQAIALLGNRITRDIAEYLTNVGKAPNPS